jgi:hypothetical protein
MKICASIGKGIPGVKSAQSTARQGGGNGPLGFGAFSALFLALFALALLPLTLSEIPPLLDYPNHLARMFLLAHLDSTPGRRCPIWQWMRPCRRCSPSCHWT